MPCRSACRRSGISGSASRNIAKAFGKTAGACRKTGKHCAKTPFERTKKEDAARHPLFCEDKHFLPFDQTALKGSI